MNHFSRFPLPWLPGLLLFAAFAALAAAQPRARIVRPVEGAALPPGEISVLAAAQDGKLTLDGEPLTAEEPFPNVLHAKIDPPPGEHTLALETQQGTEKVRFFVGSSPPAGFEPFRPHPPLAVECTQCHGVSRRGRFRFQGGCFDCHQEDGFVSIHQHPPHILRQCGMCHNAHGSTAEALLTLSRDLACKQCHN